MSLRKATSLTALLSFILMIITGVAIYIAPHRPRSDQWELMGLGKHQWQALHTNLGILLLVACVIHIVLDIKPFAHYLRSKNKTLRIFTLDFNIAALLTVWIVLSTLFELPPIHAIQEWRPKQAPIPAEQPQEYAEQETRPFPDRLPFGFSSRTLEHVCNEYGLDQQVLLQALEGLGIDNKPEWSIKRIAEENDMEPRSVFDVIQQLQNK